ncbi:MAG: putative toxin-antitoxin system toxin component, PIN family [Nanoarchaeota archaeon]
MGKKRIVLDTNILISAFGWKGNPYRILNLVIDQNFELIISQKQIEELRRVLTYPRLKITQEQQSRFLNLVLNIAIVVKTNDRLNIIKEDPSDNIILESAADNDVEYLISGNKHLLKLKKFENVKIMTAAQFLSFIKDKF